MRVLIDTNILADVLLGRDSYYDIAYNILTLCANKKVSGYIAAHSIPNLFYILRNSMSKEERRTALKDICQIVRNYLRTMIAVNVEIAARCIKEAFRQKILTETRSI